MIVFYISKGATQDSVILTETQPGTPQAANLLLINNGPIDTFTAMVNALVAQTKTANAFNFHARIQIGT